ncbi:MAG: protein kinase, partial [Bradymonadaceae bacterium]
ELTDGPDPTEHRVGAETTSSPEIPPIDPSGEGPLLNAADRFVFDRELGSGGSGRVVRVYDRLIGRSVAMKILQADDDLDAEHLERFIVEAQATGQLEHPNIVPVYDFGVVGDGTPFYTMREVRGESLRDVLAQLSEGDEYAHEEYTLVRLINLLRQISQAVHYAHVRSVIHRDLKPGNVMLGDYGEVLVMDWGLARTLEQGPPGTPVEETTSKGYTLGTPSFMPPEQARGELDEVDEASDIYGLGAILYQILTLSRPYTGTDATDVMWKVVEGELAPPSERAPDDRRVPDELEQICLKAMRADKDDRFGSARQLYEELESWLEGLQPRRAEQHRRQGDRAAEQYRRLLDESDGYGGRARDVEASLDEWASAEERERLWALEDQRDEKRAASNRAFCKAVIHYRQAIAHDPDADRAEEGLADLYWTRLRRAEKRGADRAALYFKSLLEHHDPGKYEDRLEEQVDLDVASSPADVSTTLARYETSNRRLIPGNRESLGTTPTRAESVAFGSYLLEFAPSDRPNVRRPVDVDRETERTIDVRLPPASAKREGFVYVPAGDYLTGGDPDAFDPSPPERIHVGGFFCARFPVTFGEYLAWFNELYDEYGEAAMERAPQTRQAEGLLVRYDEESGRWVPDEILIEGTARERYPEGEGHEFDLPVLGIRAEDAEAYCRWRSERDGRDYRLPTADELEKAGRGVDGRYFPWGNDFVETYCKMRDSRPENPPQPEPVGAFEEDVSPYGVRDLAGGVKRAESTSSLTADAGRSMTSPAACRSGAQTPAATTTTARSKEGAGTSTPGSVASPARSTSSPPPGPPRSGFGSSTMRQPADALSRCIRVRRRLPHSAPGAQGEKRDARRLIRVSRHGSLHPSSGVSAAARTWR